MERYYPVAIVTLVYGLVVFGMALTVSSDRYRASWLKLAQAWLQMIPSDQLKSAKETYEAIVRLRTTHGKDLNSSH